ncbi:MAG: DsbA family protein [Sulfitobacter sp.]
MRSPFAHDFRSLTLWRVLTVGAALIGLVTTSLADTPDDPFEARVRAYLLENPEIILEALEILSTREAHATMVAKISQHSDLFSEPSVLGIGPEGAPFRVVEYFDYRCAPCKALHPKLKRALESHPEIRVEMRQLPILSPGSERAARFALAAKNIAGSEAYLATHEALWHLKGPLHASAFEQIALQNDLDWVAIKTEMTSEAVSSRIEQNRDIAIDLEILGTPAFVTPTSVSFGGADAVALVAEWLSQ